MSDANHRPPPDALDRATRALRDAPVPPGPPPGVLDAAVAAVHNRLAGAVPAEVARQHRRRRIMRYVRYGSAATVAAGLLVAVGVLWVGGRTAEASFLRAIENAGKAKSVRAKVTRTDPDGTSGGQATLSVHGDRVRLDDEAFTSIVDPTTNTALRLVPATKQARKFTPSDAAAFRSPIDQLLRLKGAKPEPAGEDTIGSRRVRVFRVSGADATLFGVRGDWTVWVDPRTELPVRMRVEGVAGVPADRPHEQAAGKPAGRLQITLDDFEWGVELDPKLFDLTVLEGYMVTEAKAGEKK